jgi:hypothetical protein
MSMKAGQSMSKLSRIIVPALILLAMILILGSCQSYRYYNRYPKPRKCNCPSFSHNQRLAPPIHLT